MIDLIANIPDMKSVISSTEAFVNALDEAINDYKSFAVGKTDLWDSKYQKAFDKHVSNVFIPYCTKAKNNFDKLNKHVNKLIDKYEQIDYLGK